MKAFMTFMIAAGLLVSASALADPSPTDSWDTIRAAENIWIGPGTIHDFEMGGIFNICTDGTHLRTIKPVEACLDGTGSVSGPAGRGHYEGTCMKYGTKDLVFPVQQVVDTCLNHESTGPARGGKYTCLKFGKAVQTIATTINLQVGIAEYTQTAFPINLSRFLFFKSYTIPACN